MKTETMNPLNTAGTPRIPLVLSFHAREKFARGYRDACAELVCIDLLAGRDHTWQLTAWKQYDDFLAAAGHMWDEASYNAKSMPEFGW